MAELKDASHLKNNQASCTVRIGERYYSALAEEVNTETIIERFNAMAISLKDLMENSSDG